MISIPFVTPKVTLAAYAIGGLIAIGALLAIGGVIYHQAYVRGQAAVQAKLDKANHDIGVLQSANDSDEETIAAMLQNEQANDDLIAKQDQLIAAADQQASDAAAAIRKLQQNDQSVDAFLRTPVPDSLRRVLPYSGTGDPAGAADHNGHLAAAKKH